MSYPSDEIAIPDEVLSWERLFEKGLVV